MKKELITEKGTATYIETLEDSIKSYSFLVHLSEDKKDIDIIISAKNNLEDMLGFISFNDFVENSKDGINTTTGINLSPEECFLIENNAWDILTKKYQIAPTELIL